MPRATVSTTPERFELKTLEGGFVELKRMSYGQILDRRQLMVLTLESQKGSKDMKGQMEMANRKVQELEFQTCLVNHNLEDEEGNNLDLTTVRAISGLDPRIAQEIETIIGKMNNYDDVDSAKN